MFATLRAYETLKMTDSSGSGRGVHSPRRPVPWGQPARRSSHVLSSHRHHTKYVKLTTL